MKECKKGARQMSKERINKKKLNYYSSFFIGLILNILIGISFMMAGLFASTSKSVYNFWYIFYIITGQIAIYTLIQFVKDTN